MKWTMRNGTKIAVADMSDSHLLNTIAMLKRWAWRVVAHDLHNADLMCANVTGEMATYCAEQAFDEACEREPEDVLEEHCLVYFEMVEEARRRKIFPVRDADPRTHG